MWKQSISRIISAVKLRLSRYYLLSYVKLSANFQLICRPSVRYWAPTPIAITITYDLHALYMLSDWPVLQKSMISLFGLCIVWVLWMHIYLLLVIFMHFLMSSKIFFHYFQYNHTACFICGIQNMHLMTHAI